MGVRPAPRRPVERDADQAGSDVLLFRVPEPAVAVPRLLERIAQSQQRRDAGRRNLLLHLGGVHVQVPVAAKRNCRRARCLHPAAPPSRPGAARTRARCRSSPRPPALPATGAAPSPPRQGSPGSPRHGAAGGRPAVGRSPRRWCRGRTCRRNRPGCRRSRPRRRRATAPRRRRTSPHGRAARGTTGCATHRAPHVRRHAARPRCRRRRPAGHPPPPAWDGPRCGSRWSSGGGPRDQA